MLTVALAWIVWPLLRPTASRSVEHTAANVSIFKDQFADLDSDLARGTLSVEQHAESKSELERRLLEEARIPESARSERRPHRWSAVVVAVVAPLVAAALYWQIGNPGALSPEAAAAQDAHQPTREQIDAMIAKVKQRLEKDPGTSKGGRSWRARITRSAIFRKPLPPTQR